MKIDEIEVGELYVLNDGELYQCINTYDSDPEYEYVRVVKLSMGAGYCTESLHPLYYREGVRTMFNRKATDEDIAKAVDSYFEKIEDINDDLRYYCARANGLAKKLVDRYAKD